METESNNYQIKTVFRSLEGKTVANVITVMGPIPCVCVTFTDGTRFDVAVGSAKVKRFLQLVPKHKS